MVVDCEHGQGSSGDFPQVQGWRAGRHIAMDVGVDQQVVIGA